MAFWLDYTVEQGLNSFRITGDWDKEVMGYGPDGEPGGPQSRPLYNAGEVYIVGEDGWLRKVDDLTKMILLNRDSNPKQSQQHDPKP